LQIFGNEQALKIDRGQDGVEQISKRVQSTDSDFISYWRRWIITAFINKCVSGTAWSGLVIMFQSYDYISLFVPFFNITMSLGSLFQGIASIYDRFNLPCLNKLFEEN